MPRGYGVRWQSEERAPTPLSDGRARRRAVRDAAHAPPPADNPKAVSPQVRGTHLLCHRTPKAGATLVRLFSSSTWITLDPALVCNLAWENGRRRRDGAE